LIVDNHITLIDSEVIGGIGVDLHDYPYSEPPTKKIHFGMVSRLLVEKGVREFVEAAKLVKSKYPDVQFSIAGAIDDNPGGITREQLNVWKKEGYVDFLGQISDVKNYLCELSVFVLPSYREGIPRSTQEAMSIGRAIITTDVPGCRETINHRINADAMISLINNPEQIVSMGIESRRIAEGKFDEDVATDKLINILLDQK